MASGKPEAADSVYRCVECGDGQHLTAWAGASVYGALGADGQLVDSAIWDDVLYEDSIECSRHVGAMIEKRVDGQWCRWWVCPECEGKTRPAGYQCREPGLPPLPRTYGQRHKGWRPVGLAAAEPRGGKADA